MSYRGNPYCGGQGIYVQYLAHELVKLGHEVSLMVGPPYPFHLDGARELRVPNNIYFGSSTRQILDGTDLSSLLSPLNLYEYTASRFGVFPEIRAFSFRAYFRLRELLMEQRFDIIHDNQCLGYGFLLMKAFGIPIVSTIHHPLTIDRRVWFENPSSKLKQKIKMILYYPLIMQRIVSNRLDGIVTVSEDAAGRIVRSFGVPREKIRVVHNGLDASIFRPVEAVPKVPKRIIFVGNVGDPKKGFDYLLKAMAKLEPDIELIVVDGGTPARIRTQELVGRYALKHPITITGKISREKLVEWYGTAQLAVVPSLYEGFCFPAAEAMACGIPVVSTDAGALPEVVGTNGEAGILVSARDPEALANAIRSLLSDPERCDRMGRAARERVLNTFTWRRATEKLVDVYREIIDAHC